jgi:uncharacterized SAM-dependent methyltransferase
VLVSPSDFGENVAMSSLANVAVHRSQFPVAVRRDLLDSLRARAVNHKFHYDTVRQARKWLALHEAFSPARTDPDCASVYDDAFEAVVAHFDAPRAHVVGLGCGGGQKDAQLLRLLKQRGIGSAYSPVDSSLALVLTARAEALAALVESDCHPLVCDLGSADDLPAVLANHVPRGAPRILTFFGMLPNFAPDAILPKLAALTATGDRLLVSANLAPGHDYESGVRSILPLYDNPLTRDWLMTFLLDLGVEARDGELRFSIEDDAPHDLKRVAAHFHFVAHREIIVDSEQFVFHPGESFRLFFSYRHTAGRVRKILAPYGLRVLDEWITRSGEEGVFLAGRPADHPN